MDLGRIQLCLIGRRLHDGLVDASSQEEQRRGRTRPGKSGRLIGNLTGLLVVLKGLPLSYNRDLQEDKEPLFDSIRQILLVLRALAGAYGSLEFHDEVAAAAADDELLVAIDIAEELVSEGVPFRQAHEQVGLLVAESIATGTSLRDLVRSAPSIERFGVLFDSGAALKRRASPGASGPRASAEQSRLLKAAIAEAKARME